MSQGKKLLDALRLKATQSSGRQVSIEDLNKTRQKKAPLPKQTRLASSVIKTKICSEKVRVPVSSKPAAITLDAGQLDAERAQVPEPNSPPNNVQQSTAQCSSPESDVVSDFTPSEVLMLHPQSINPGAGTWDSDVELMPSPSIANVRLVSYSSSSLSSPAACSVTPRRHHLSSVPKFTNPAAKVKQWLFKPDQSPKPPGIILPDVKLQSTLNCTSDKPVTRSDGQQKEHMVPKIISQVQGVSASLECTSIPSEVVPEEPHLDNCSEKVDAVGNILSSAVGLPINIAEIPFDQPVIQSGNALHYSHCPTLLNIEDVTACLESASTPLEGVPEEQHLDSPFDAGNLLSPEIMSTIDMAEITPDQPVIQPVNELHHNSHRTILNNKTGDTVRKQLFEKNQVAAPGDILVLPLNEAVVMEENVFRGEVIQADTVNVGEVVLTDTDDEEMESDKTAPRNKRIRSRNNDATNDEPLTKKRKLKPSQWKANQAKLAYNSGLPHTSLRGKQKPGRSLKVGCGNSCRRKCHNNISEERRQELFSQYWGLKDKMLQWYFLAKLIHTVPIQRRTVVAEEKHFRTINYEYILPDADGNQIKICQKMFIDTFDISLSVVRTAISKNSPDKRGRHDHHRKLSIDLINGVKSHIKSFPMVESHYCRADSKRMYLDEHLSVAKMHRLYLLERDLKDPNTASLRQYRDIFNNYFNLSFFKPKKDQCSLCTEWKSAKEETQARYDEHQNSKIFVRALKKQDKETSRDSSSEAKMRVLTCDMQKVLYCPKSELGEFYYKRKLSVYDFTIFDCTLRQGHLYVWDQTIGKKGSDETSSFLQHYIETAIKEHSIDTFVIYSDSCGGQNKNQFLFTMYYTIAMRHKVTIIQRYLEKGHTQMECDSVHARVEKKIKKQDVFTPSQYYGLMKTAKVKKPVYIVHEVKQSEIYHYRDLAPHLKWDKIQVSKLREIQIGPNPGVVKYKHNWTEELKEVPILVSKVGRRVRWDTVKPALAHTQAIPVPAKLRTDLAWMVKKGYIPNEYVPIYNKWCSVTNPLADVEEKEEDDLPTEVIPNHVVVRELMERSYEGPEFEMANPLRRNEEEEEENEDDVEARSNCGDSGSDEGSDDDSD